MRLAALWSTRTFGIVAIAALGVAALAGAVWLIQGNGHHNVIVATGAQQADGTRVDYVGYDASSFSPTAGYDADAVAHALSEWRSAHAGAQLLDQAPVEKNGLTLGYTIHYR